MKHELKFADKVTMDELNPHNFALKNEYISNTISTALNVLPVINAIVGSDKVNVTRCFLSRRFIFDEMNIPVDRIDDFLLHSEGLAIEVSIDEWEHELAILICKEVISNNDCAMKTLVDLTRNRLSFYYVKDLEKSIIESYTKDGIRTILKY